MPIKNPTLFKSPEAVSPNVTKAVYKKERLFDNLDEQPEKPVKLDVCAKFLGKSEVTVRRYARLRYKGFPAFHICGRTYYVKLSSVSKWLSDLERNFLDGN